MHPPPGPDPGVRDRRTAAGAALPHRHPRWAAVPASGEPGGGPPCAGSSGGWPHPHAGLRQHGRAAPGATTASTKGRRSLHGGRRICWSPSAAATTGCISRCRAISPPRGSGAGIGLYPRDVPGICTPRDLLLTKAGGPHHRRSLPLNALLPNAVWFFPIFFAISLPRPFAVRTPTGALGRGSARG
mgnify:CR=1 FL=1